MDGQRLGSTSMKGFLLLRCWVAYTSSVCRRRDISHTLFFVDGQRLGSTSMKGFLLLRYQIACTSSVCWRRDISHTPFFVDEQRLGSTSVQEVLEALLQPDLRFSHAKLMSAGAHGPPLGSRISSDQAPALRAHSPWQRPVHVCDLEED